MLFYKILLILAIAYIGIIQNCCAELTDQSDLLKKPLFLQAQTLQENPTWQQFVNNKELIDLNYDLYRVKGPNNNDKVVLGQDPKNYFIDKHNRMFCSTVSDPNCRVQAIYTYGDIKFSHLLKKIYNNQDEFNLATEIARNIVNPFPSNLALEMKAANNYDKSLPANKAALAELYASQARLGVVRNSFNTMLRNRMSLGLIEGGGKENTPQHSIQSIMEQGSQDNFTNSAWQEKIDNSNQEQLLKELVKMEAFKSWVDYHRYKQNERIEALLATMVAQQETLSQLLTSKHAKNN